MQSGDPTGDSLYYPVVQGVNPLSALPSLASVKTQTINPYTWGPQEATINTWFDSNIVRLCRFRRRRSRRRRLAGGEPRASRRPPPARPGCGRPGLACLRSG
jgi:hypothetical protein